MGANRRGDRVKRVTDVIVAGVLGLLTAVPLLVVAVAIRVRMGSPVLFIQERPGLHGRIFRLYKFRTMAETRDGQGRLLPDGQRLTALGRFLRATSLDELPQLINVLKGDMSLVGPRPLLVEYLDRYTPEQRRRHEVRPGITGLAQVSGRNALDWEQRFTLDLWYVDHRSFLLDLRILLLTVAKVVRKQGIAAPGYATMEEFKPGE